MTLSRRQLIMAGGAAGMAGISSAATGGPQHLSQAVLEAVHTHGVGVANAIRSGQLTRRHVDRMVTASATLFGHLEETGWNAYIARQNFTDTAPPDVRRITSLLPPSVAVPLIGVLPVTLQPVEPVYLGELPRQGVLQKYEVDAITLLKEYTEFVPASFSDVISGGHMIRIIDKLIAGGGLIAGGTGLAVIGTNLAGLLGSGTAATVTAVGLTAAGGGLIVVGLMMVVLAVYASR